MDFWNDNDMIEFARIATEGSYGEYEGCRKLIDKLNKYKMIRENQKEQEYQDLQTIAELEQCIKGLKLFFDYASIDMLKFHKKHGKVNYKKFDAAINFMYKNFDDE